MATSKSGRDLREMADEAGAVLGDTARHYSNEVVEGIREKATEAGQAIRHAAEEAKDRSDRLARDLAELIARRPLPSLLIAAGIGFLVGGAAFGRLLAKRR